MHILKDNKIILKKSFNFPCSYINGKSERRLYIDLKKSNNKNLLVSELTLNGFRRNHDHMYIPICQDCTMCISSRVNIVDFRLSKSNKRNLKINNDLFIRTRSKEFDKKRFHLFKEYCNIRHNDSQMKNMSETDFENFFYKSENQNIVFDLIDSNFVLYGSILIDVLNDGFSAVYSFYLPNEKKRGLGKNLILKLIQELKKKKLPFLYLGYWIKGCNKMDYKNSFNGIELYQNGNWVPKSKTLKI